MGAYLVGARILISRLNEQATAVCTWLVPNPCYFELKAIFLGCSVQSFSTGYFELPLVQNGEV